MICFITTPGHDYTLEGLRPWPFRDSSGLPVVTGMDYHALFRTGTLPAATYVFTDIERLYPWELRLAAERYRSLRAAGLPCLNDPARILTRYALLRALARAGINGFSAYAADDAPRPARFPVFVRSTTGHNGGTSALLGSQAALERHLAERTASGESPSDCIVVEYVETRRPDGTWGKAGTYRIGRALHFDHTDYGDGWIVRGIEGSEHLWTDARAEEDRRLVVANANPEAVKHAFALSGIEWGRADWSVQPDGKVAVFEINTNPYSPLRSLETAHDRTRLFARRRLATLLARIDTPEGPAVEIADGRETARSRRRRMLDPVEPLRP